MPRIFATFRVYDGSSPPRTHLRPFKIGNHSTKFAASHSPPSPSKSVITHSVEILRLFLFSVSLTASFRRCPPCLSTSPSVSSPSSAEPFPVGLKKMMHLQITVAFTSEIAFLPFFLLLCSLGFFLDRVFIFFSPLFVEAQAK
ncbi:hypothetical protein K1719_019121 [Acacia pycnantha]|nr:hypothetical protein K1719_019121 [Acacia pycnantha]